MPLHIVFGRHAHFKNVLFQVSVVQNPMYATTATTNADMYEIPASDCAKPVALGMGADYHYDMPAGPTEEYSVVADSGELSTMYEVMPMPVNSTESMPEAAYDIATCNASVFDAALVVPTADNSVPSRDNAENHFDTAKPEEASVHFYDTASNSTTPGKLSATRFSQYDLASSGEIQEGSAYSNPVMLQNRLKQKSPHTYELEKKLRSVKASAGVGPITTYDVAGSHADAVYNLGDNSSGTPDVAREYLNVAPTEERYIIT